MSESSNNNTAIEVSNVSKQFLLPHQRSSTLKSSFLQPFKRYDNEKQMALNDVSFNVKKGEFFGIVGRNGSGKSTLLKCMAGVYTPDKGHIQVNGSLVPFIELGVGFNPELSGRDNVFLNGALLGFSRSQMEEMYNEIVEFAELEEHMDQKLKNYSSGMQVRLAFSIAIQAKGDILLLDEVLAVGDGAFQKKCIDIFEKYKAEKRTIILVTHSMDIVEKFCDRALLLDKGKLETVGKPTEVIGTYKEINEDKSRKDLRKQNKKIAQSRINLRIKNKKGSSTAFFSGDTMGVEISWPKDIENVKNTSCAIFKKSGEFIFGSNTLGKNPKFINNKADYEVELSLGPGTYYLVSRLLGDTKDDIIDSQNEGPQFIVMEKENVVKGQQNGLARFKHKWHLDHAENQ